MKLLFIALLLTSCASSDRMAGKVAARVTNGVCVEFQRHGRADTAAFFRHEGYWWRYHPAKGSVKTPWKSSQPPPFGTVLTIKGAEGPIREIAVSGSNAAMPNGCLPIAIARQRALGGQVVQVSEHHVEHMFRP